MSILKQSITLLCLFFLQNAKCTGYDISWLATIDSVSTLSSPKSADLNLDDIKDIVLGVGNEYDTINYVVALDGKNGVEIWRTSVDSDIYGSPLFHDVNHDNIPDIYITGRKKGLFCLDGSNGRIIWKFSSAISPELYALNYNFYQPKLFSGTDSSTRLLITYGGNADLPPHSTERKTGYILILDPENGNILAQDSMPDSHETYSSPQIFRKDDENYFVLGTGGETHQGSLWLSKISDISTGLFSKNAVRMDGPYSKGFLQPCLIADLNNDKVLDYISVNLDGYISAIDGKSLERKWQLAFPGYEIYSSPTPLYFTQPDALYIAITIGEGEFETGYTSFKTLLINAHDGSYQTINDKGALYQINSGVSYTESDQAHFIYSYNQYSDDEYKVEYRDIQLPGNTESSVTGALAGNNIGSTPLLEDIDNDGLAELVINYNEQDFRTISKVKVLVFDTDIPVENIIWGNYMGANQNNIYLPGITTNANEKNTLSLVKSYPNPTTDIIHVTSPYKIFKADFYNAEGGLVYSSDYKGINSISPSLANHPAGVYFILLYTEQGFHISRFIKK